MINQKPKQCNGIGKARGFEGCGKETSRRTYGLCPSCYFDFMTNDERGRIIYQKKFIPKVKAATDRNSAETKKALREKTENWHVKLTEKLQLIARLIDYGQPCPARGYTDCQFHGGHVETKGGHFAMKFNLHNIHRQSAQSNNWHNDADRFKEGLAKEYGIGYIDFIQEMRQIKPLKYKNEQYHQFYKKASKIALELAKNKSILSATQRIELRNWVNSEIGIYEPKFSIYETIK